MSKFSINPDQHLLIYSHSTSDISQSIYRCHGPIISTSHSQCTCQQQQGLPTTSSISEFQQSLSVVDYIDFDVSDETSSASSTSKPEDDDDPLTSLKYLFDDNQKQTVNGNFIRRTPRRSTNTSSISADSGYSDIPTPPSKLIPVQLISCTLIPVNVTRTESMDMRCLTCTCPSSSSSYFSTKTERQNPQQRRRRRKSSTTCQTHRTYSRAQMNIIENEMNNPCPCSKKYYSTMTICPTLSFASTATTKSIPKINSHQKEDYYAQQRKKRSSLLKYAYLHADERNLLYF